MKKYTISCTLMLCGSIMFGLGFIADALYSASNNNSLFLTITGAVFLIGGLLLTLFFLFRKSEN